MWVVSPAVRHTQLPRTKVRAVWPLFFSYTAETFPRASQQLLSPRSTNMPTVQYIVLKDLFTCVYIMLTHLARCGNCISLRALPLVHVSTAPAASLPLAPLKVLVMKPARSLVKLLRISKCCPHVQCPVPSSCLPSELRLGLWHLPHW